VTVETPASESRPLRRYLVEALIGLALAAALTLAALASTGEIPFVYQGY